LSLSLSSLLTVGRVDYDYDYDYDYDNDNDSQERLRDFYPAALEIPDGARSLQMRRVFDT